MLSKRVHARTTARDALRREFARRATTATAAAAAASAEQQRGIMTARPVADCCRRCVGGINSALPVTSTRSLRRPKIPTLRLLRACLIE